MKKRLLSLFLAVCMMLSLTPSAVFAEETAYVDSELLLNETNAEATADIAELHVGREEQTPADNTENPASQADSESQNSENAGETDGVQPSDEPPTLDDVVNNIDEEENDSEGNPGISYENTSNLPEIVLSAVAEDGTGVVVTAAGDAFVLSDGTVLTSDELELCIAPLAANDAAEVESNIDSANVVDRTTYDVSIMYQGIEIEPVPGKTVRVAFGLNYVPQGAEAVNVYHIDDTNEVERVVTESPVQPTEVQASAPALTLTAEVVEPVSEEDADASENEAPAVTGELPVNQTSENEEAALDLPAENESVLDELLDAVADVQAETEVDRAAEAMAKLSANSSVVIVADVHSFSAYTVEFVFNSKSVKLDCDNPQALAALIAQYGITSSIVDVQLYRLEDCSGGAYADRTAVDTNGNTLFKAYQYNNAWYVESYRGFDTAHGMTVEVANPSGTGTVKYNFKITSDGAAPSAFIRGYAVRRTTGLRVSELLEVVTTGFAPDAQLQYSYSVSNSVSNARCCIDVFYTPNMYVMTRGGTENEILITNGNSKTFDSSYNKGIYTFSDYRFLAACMQYQSGSSNYSCNNYATQSVTVTVKDVSTTSATKGKTATYTYTGFANASLQEDVNNAMIVLFKGEEAELTELLGYSGITHIACSNSSVSSLSTLDSNVAAASGDELIGVNIGETTAKSTIKKGSSCDHHTSQSASGNTKVYVTGKPYGTAQGTAVVYEPVPGLVYVINGQRQVSQNGEPLTFTNVEFGKTYPCTVIAQEGERYSARECEFTMPEKVTYKITITYYYDGDRGTATSEQYEYLEGERVFINCLPKDGYAVDKVDYSNGTDGWFIFQETHYDSATKIDDGTNVNYWFEMPDENSTVRVYFTDHEHQWTYTAEGNTITATCSDMTKHPYGPEKLQIGAVTRDYNGEPNKAVLSAGYVGGVTGITEKNIKYYKVEGTKETLMSSAPVDAGSYKATITVEGVTAYVYYGINKITGLGVVIQDDWGYGETNPPAPVLRSDTHSTAAADVIIEYKDANAEDSAYSTVRPTEVGTYTIRATFKENTNYLQYVATDTFEIFESKAKVLTAPTANDLTYNGANQTLITAGTAQGGTMMYCIGSESAPGTKWGETLPEGLNAGTYYVWYMVKGDDNHGDSDPVKLPVNIKKKAPTAPDFDFTAPSNTEYDGNAKTAEVAVKAGIVGMGTGITAEYYDANGVKLNSAPADAGTYTVKINVTEGTNYTSGTALTAAEWTFTITPKKVGEDQPEDKQAIASGPDAKTYTGSKIEPTDVSVTLADLTALNEGTDYDLTYPTAAGANIDAGTNAGTMYVVFKGNYEGTLTLGFDINKATVTVSGIKGVDKTYDGTTAASLDYSGLSLTGRCTPDESKLSATASGAFKTADAGNDKDVDLSGLSLTGTAAKNYVLDTDNSQKTTKADIIPKQHNDDHDPLKPREDDPKSPDYNPGDFKATLDAIADKNHTGDPIVPDATEIVVRDENGNVIDKSNYDVEYSDNTNVGTAKVKITFKNNYGGTLNGSFNILGNPQTIEVEVTNGTSTPAAVNKKITVEYGKDAKITFAPTDSTYIIDTVTVNGNPVKLAADNSFTFTKVTDSDNKIVVVFSKDELSDNPKNPGKPNEPDGIPDTHQKTVTYQIVNGYWSGTDDTDKAYVFTVDVQDKDTGAWTAIAEANLPVLGSTIPTGMSCKPGYETATKGWNKTFDSTTKVRDDVTYIYRYDNIITAEKTANSAAKAPSLNEKLYYTITVKNISDSALSGIKVAEAEGNVIEEGAGYTVSGNEATITSVPAGGSVSVSVYHVVTSEDILAGGYNNEANVSYNDIEIPLKTKGDTKEVVAGFDVSKTVTNEGTGTGKTFRLGEYVQYKITAKNNGNVPLHNVKIVEQAGVEMVADTGNTYEISVNPTTGIHTAKYLVNNGTLNPGETITVYAKMAVTSEHIAAGEIKNVAVANADKVKDPKSGEDKDPKTEIPNDGAVPEDVNPHFLAEKSVVNKGTGVNDAFKPGDVIEYKIYAKNDGNVPLTNVKVSEQAGVVIDTAKNPGFEVTENPTTHVYTAVYNEGTLEIGDSITVYAKMTVTSDDIKAGKIVNTAAVIADKVDDPKGGDPKDPTEKPKDENAPLEEVNPSFETSKTVAPGCVGSSKDNKFTTGDVVKYVITAKNDGNVPLTNVKVVEQPGVVIKDGTGYTVSYDDAADVYTATLTGGTLAIGATLTVKAELTVTSDDIVAGEIKNVAVAKADPVKGKDPKEEIPNNSAPPEEVDPSFRTLKNVDEGCVGTGKDNKFKPGDVVKYTITATNNGNVPLTNVKVIEQAGAVIDPDENPDFDVEEDPTTHIHTAVYKNGTLGIGETLTVKAKLTVTSDNIKAGEIRNVATVTADKVDDPKGGSPKDPTEKPEDKNAPPEELNPEFTAEKKVTNEGTGTDKTFKLGEKVEYTIKAKNTGNVPLTNVKVSEQPGVVIDPEDNSDFDVSVNPATGVYTAKLKSGTLAIGGEITVKAELTVTSDHIKAGKIFNAATVTADKVPDPKGGEPKDPTTKPNNDKAQPEDVVAHFDAEKKVTNKGTGTDDKFKPGDVVEYTIIVTNDGNVPLDNVKVSEQAGAEIVADQAGTYTVEMNPGTKVYTAVLDKVTLAVGESMTVYAKMTVTSDHVEAGEIKNVATAKADKVPDPKDEEHPKNPEREIPNNSAPPEEVNPSFEVSKTVAPGCVGTGKDNKFTTGDVVKYVITAKNDGNVPLTNVKVVEQPGVVIKDGEGYTVSSADNVWTATLTGGTLAIGATMTVNAELTVSSDDIKAGEIKNVAVAKADPVKGKDPKEEIPNNSAPPEEVNPSFEVSKTVAPGCVGTGKDGAFKLGEVVKYVITAKNDGNVPLTNVKVVEQPGVVIKDGDGYTVSSADNVWTATLTGGTLAIGATMTVNAELTVTGDHIKAGEIRNVAVAKADPVQGKDPEEEIPNNSAPPEEVNPSFDASKTYTNSGEGKGVGGVFKPGNVVKYEIKATNDGNVPLTNVKVYEQKGAVIKPGEGYSVSHDDTLDVDVATLIAGTLGIGETLTVNAELTVTEDHVKAGKIENEATVTADKVDDPKGGDPKDPTEKPKDENAPLEGVSTGFELTKTVTNAGKGSGTDGAFRPGDKVEYTITAKNIGNVPLTNVKVTEQPNVIIKTNSGYSVQVDTEKHIYTAVLNGGTLAVGATMTVFAQLTVTSDDITEGKISNTATASADKIKDPKTGEDKDPTKNVTNEDAAPETLNPSFGTLKKVDEGCVGTGKDNKFKPGDVVKYTITATNDGNVPLNNVQIVEQPGVVIKDGTGYTVSYDDAADVYTATLTGGTLAIGATMTVNAELTVTSDDIKAGEIKNVAVAKADPVKGKDPKEEIPNNSAPPEEVDPGFSTSKIIDNDCKGSGENGKFTTGDVVKYTITATNNGNVPLTTVKIKEQPGVVIKDGEGYTVSSADNVWTATLTADTLAIGAAMTVKAELTVTSDQIKAGEIKNVATVSADPVKGKDPTKEIPNKEAPPAEVNPSFEVSKTVAPGCVGTGKDNKFTTGNVVKYVITAKNDGNVPLTNVTIDEQPGVVIKDGEGYTVSSADNVWTATLTGGTLAVGATMTVNAELTVTSDDIKAGEIRNVAVAKADPVKGKDPKEEIPNNSAPPEEVNPSFNTEKKVAEGCVGSGKDGKFTTDDVVKYVITAKNDGNVPLTNVKVIEQAGAFIDPDENPDFDVEEDPTTHIHTAVYKNGTLGIDETLTVKAKLTVTSDNIKAGEIRNVATVTADKVDDPKGGSPKDPTEKPEDKNAPPEALNPGFEMTKKITNTGTGTGGAYMLGETVEYEITVKNNGNVPLEGVKITEQPGVIIDPEENPDFEVSMHPTTKAYTAKLLNSTLAREELVTVYAQLPVTSDNIKDGYIHNTATAAANKIKDPATGLDKEPKGEVKNEEAKPEALNAHFSVSKEATNSGSGKNGSFKPGEVVKYTITATNNGNVPLTNVKIVEQEGVRIKNGTGYTVSSADNVWTATLTGGTLEVGKTMTVYAELTVSSDDIVAGKITNVAVVKADPVDDPEKPEEPQDPETEIPNEEAPPEELNPHFDAEKKITNTGGGANGAFKLGETIKYTITAKNDGNVPLTSVEVEEQEGVEIYTYEGCGYTVAQDPSTNKFTATLTGGTLAIGNTLTVYAKHVVTSDDILAGSIDNKAVVKADDIKGKDPTEEPEKNTPNVEPIDGSYDVTKTPTSTPANGQYYVLGEVVTYDVVVENTGNVPYTGAKVTEIDGNTILDGTGYTVVNNEALIGDMAVGAPVTVKVSHEVTSADITKGKVINTVTASADEIPNPIPGQDPIKPNQPTTDDTPKTSPVTGSFDTSKVIINRQEGKSFKKGETILYKITVKNTGNVPYSGVKVTEPKGMVIAENTALYTLSTDKDGNNIASFKADLPVNSPVEIYASHVVTEDDVKAGKVVNNASVAADPIPNPLGGDPIVPSAPIENELPNLDTKVYQIVYRYDDAVGAAPKDAPTEGIADVGTVTNVKPATPIKVGDVQYALVSVTQVTISQTAADNVVYVDYGTDAIGPNPGNPDEPNKPDGKPDCCQKVVTIAVVNGKITETGKTSKVYVIDLVNDKGELVKTGSGVLTVPGMTPNETCGGGSWGTGTPAISGGKMTVTGNNAVTYTYTYAGTSVDKIPDQTYTGSPITPALTVKDEKGNVLEEGKDYTVEYSNNTDVTTAEKPAVAKVKLKGEYSGTLTVNFNILPKQQKENPDPANPGEFKATTDGPADVTYNNTFKKPTDIKVYDGAKQLKVNVDYTLRYPVNASGERQNIDAGANAGTVYIDFKGNYGGDSVTLSFNINKADPKPSDFDYKAPTDLNYDGNPKEATVTVKSGIVGMGENITVKYMDKKGNISADAPSAPGRYIVYIDVDEGLNYNEGADLTSTSGSGSSTKYLWQFKISGYLLPVLNDEIDPDNPESIEVDGEQPETRADDEDHTTPVVFDTNAKIITTYQYNGDQLPDHEKYPVHMNGWVVKYDADEDDYSDPENIEIFDDALRYRGFAIRVKGKRGIRMLTAVGEQSRNAMINGVEILGKTYTLKEYGTLMAWASDYEQNGSLTLNNVSGYNTSSKAKFALKAEAYRKADGYDAIFETGTDTRGNLEIRWTNALVKSSGDFTGEEIRNDFAMRPYIVLRSTDGSELVIYGAVLIRSIGYIATQVKDYYSETSAAGKYIAQLLEEYYAG